MGWNLFTSISQIINLRLKNKDEQERRVAAENRAADEQRRREAAESMAAYKHNLWIEALKKAAEESKARANAAREKALAEAQVRAGAEARLAAKNEAIAYSQNQTNTLRNTIMATIAMEAEATKKAQEASDVATRLKFERIAEESKNLALKRNAERKELLEQIEKNKLEADRLQKETRNEFVGEVGKITKWQDEHTKMPVNFVVNFLPSNV